MLDNSEASHPIYPAYTFFASPTYFAWVKTTAAIIHRLRSVRGFEGSPFCVLTLLAKLVNCPAPGQKLYFLLNHPIRFVSITAPVVSIEDVASKYALITLDDGSGATVVAKITRVAAEIASSVECPSNTTVDNVNVRVNLGTFDVEVDGQILDIGMIVKAKCTINEWKGVKQLDLVKIKVIRDTSEEIKEWEEAARWKREVLDKPWVLDDKQLAEMEKKDRDQRQNQLDQLKKAEEKKRMYLAKKRERQQKRKDYEEKWEGRRRKEEVMMNAGALI